MTSMRVLTKTEVVGGVPLRWARQYKESYWDDSDIAQITDALRALKPGFTAEQVNEIIGNEGWTRLECGLCERDVPSVVVFERYDDSIHVCRDCLNSALSILPREEA